MKHQIFSGVVLAVAAIYALGPQLPYTSNTTQSSLASAEARAALASDGLAHIGSNRIAYSHLNGIGSDAVASAAQPIDYASGINNAIDGK